MGPQRKNKKRSAKVTAAAENRPPPVLTKEEVQVARPIIEEDDESSDTEVEVFPASPAVSESSSHFSLLSIPPPNGTGGEVEGTDDTNLEENLGASENSLSSFVAETLRKSGKKSLDITEDVNSTQSKGSKSQMSKKSGAKEKTPCSSKRSRTPKREPVAGTSRKAAAVTVTNIPLRTPPVAGSSKKSHVPTSWMPKIIIPAMEVVDVSEITAESSSEAETARSTTVEESNFLGEECEKNLIIDVSEMTIMTRETPSDVETTASTIVEEENFWSDEFEKSLVEPSTQRELSDGEPTAASASDTIAKSVPEKNESEAQESVDIPNLKNHGGSVDVTDELLANIDNGEGMFQALMQFDLTDFPTINECMSPGGGGEEGTDSRTEQAPAATDKSDNEPKTNGPVGIQHLDGLQTELEFLRSSMVSRVSTIEKDHERLNEKEEEAQEHVDEFVSRYGHLSPAAVGVIQNSVLKRSSRKGNNGNQAKDAVEPVADPPISTPKPGTSKSSEKPKTRSQPVRGRGGSGGKKKTPRKGRGRKAKSCSESVPGEGEGDDDEDPDPAFLNPEQIPEQFYKFTDQWCCKITQEDIDKLDIFIAEHDKLDESLFQIPPLGKHYKEQAEAEGKTKTNGKEEPKPGPSSSASSSGPPKRMVDQTAQRLVKALVNEKVAMYKNTRARARAEALLQAAKQAKEPSTSGQSLVNALGLDGSGATAGQPLLDEAVKKCLPPEEGGSKTPKHDPEDEILAEIIRTQELLLKLHKSNQETLAEMRRKAVRQMEIDKINDQIDVVDRRILDLYTIRQRNPHAPMTAEFKAEANKAMYQRVMLINILNKKTPPEPSAPGPGPSGAQQEQPTSTTTPSKETTKGAKKAP